MEFDFDSAPPRHQTGSTKWDRYPADVLPMWVADTDFPAPSCITDALQTRLNHGVFGYATIRQSLRDRIVAYTKTMYGWTIAPEDIVLLPGVVAGFNMALKAFLAPGETVAVQLPVYPPMLHAAGHWALNRHDLRLTPADDGTWHMDLKTFDAAMTQSQAFLFCHPHNPTGKVFTAAELHAIAESCAANDTLIISDEIHCDLLFDNRRHIPIASLSPEIANRTITLMAASKTFNIAGLKTAYAIIPNPALRRRFDATRLGLVDSINVFGLVATEAALAGGEPWRQALLAYLQSNRDTLMQAVATLPGVSLRSPQSTFLAWLDCTGTGVANPYQFFLDTARVGLNPGPDFDPAAKSCVRLNFGCTRATLQDGLARLARSLAA